jgi:hypothetical protein
VNTTELEVKALREDGKRVENAVLELETENRKAEAHLDK